MFSFLRRRSAAPAAPRSHSFRPRLEALEDRTLPHGGFAAGLADSLGIANARAHQETAALAGRATSPIAETSTWTGNLVAQNGTVKAATLTITPGHGRHLSVKFVSAEGTIATGEGVFHKANEIRGSLRSPSEQIHFQADVLKYADANTIIIARFVIHKLGGGKPTYATLYAALTTPNVSVPSVGGPVYVGSSQSNLPGTGSLPMTVALTQTPGSNSIGGNIYFSVNGGAPSAFAIRAGVVSPLGMIDVVAQTTDGSNLTLKITASFTTVNLPPPVTIGPPSAVVTQIVSGNYFALNAASSPVDAGTFTVDRFVTGFTQFGSH
jgi:hypothetical protein